MLGSIAINDADVLQVRRAFGNKQELGVVLARLLLLLVLTLALVLALASALAPALLVVLVVLV